MTALDDDDDDYAVHKAYLLDHASFPPVLYTLYSHVFCLSIMMFFIMPFEEQ